MKRHVIAALLVALAAACAQSTAAPSATSTSTSSSRRASTTAPKAPSGPQIRQPVLDAIANRYRSSCKSPGAAIGIRTGVGATYFATSGRLAPGIALGRDSEFLAGSVTKLFVATVAYQLIAAHKLALDQVVDQFIPGWPRGNQISIAMLLGHRSGMGNFGNDFGPQLRALVLSDLSRVFRYREVLDLVRAVPPVAAPGTTYHYSNANYIVLGAILQRITHTTLGRLFDTRIIEPLRLRHTLYGPDDLAAADHIVFHGLFDVSGNGTFVDIGGFPRAAALTVDPAGAGMFSSLPDLLTFTYAAFATHTLLAAPQRSGLAGAVSTLTAKDLLLDKRFTIHGHGGASPGAQTIVAYDSNHRATVAVWCNRLDPGTYELLPSVVAAKEAFELVATAGTPPK
jgi:D-alanyl-D-alanine carboxypeptidase